MPARRCEESKIRNGRPRDFPHRNAWDRAVGPRIAGLVGQLGAVVGHQAEEEAAR